MFIKRVVVFISFGLFAVLNLASAQTITAGVIGGADFASQLHPGEAIDRLTGTSTLFTAEKPGFEAGGFVTTPITKHLALQPEVLFVQKGVKLDQTDNVTTVTIKVNYVEVPLLLRIGRTTGTESSGGFVLVGPSVGIRSSVSAQTDFGGTSRPLNVDAVYRQLDLGLVLASGVEIHRFVIEVRYTVGVSDIVDAKSYPHRDSIKNRVLALMAGFKF
jgi:outer membrane protein with beta-barrel domain